MKIPFCFFVFLLSCFLAASVSAHQPRMIENQNPIVINNPEVSQAFYEVLSGKSQFYTIDSDAPFTLYVNLLVPKSSNPYERYGAKVYQILETEKKQLINIRPFDKKWTLFHEEFANDDYYQGSEFEQDVPAGQYEIEVYSDINLGRYVLAVGKKEAFGVNSLLMMLTILPNLKINFFEVSPLTLITSRLGILLVVELAILILLSFLIWKLIRWILKKIFKKYHFENNMNRLDRLLRLVLGLVFLVLAINYWSYILFAISTLAFYAAASGWCGLYTILKMNKIKAKNKKK